MYVKVVPLWCLLCGYKRMHAWRNVDMWSLLSAWAKVDIHSLGNHPVDTTDLTLRCDLCQNLCPSMCCT